MSQWDCNMDQTKDKTHFAVLYAQTLSKPSFHKNICQVGTKPFRLDRECGFASEPTRTNSESTPTHTMYRPYSLEPVSGLPQNVMVQSVQRHNSTKRSLDTRNVNRIDHKIARMKDITHLYIPIDTNFERIDFWEYPCQVYANSSDLKKETIPRQNQLV